MLVKDPLQVKYYERLLRRKLTEAERLGQIPIRLDGNKVYLELTDVSFPYGFMTETQLHSLLANRTK